jgi:hypothetical protein
LDIKSDECSYGGHSAIYHRIIHLDRRTRQAAEKAEKAIHSSHGEHRCDDIEDVIVDLKQDLAEQQQANTQMKAQLIEMQSTLTKQKGKVGVIRYNAFAEQGSNLSFSIAIINDEKDGAVFSGIHNRENSYIYAKPLEKGQSNYPLTPEELKAILEAK